MKRMTFGAMTLGLSAFAGLAGAETLTLLHNSDGESALLQTVNTVNTETGSLELKVGGIAAFKSLFDSEQSQASQAGHAVVSVYAGDAFLASSTLACSMDNKGLFYDGAAQSKLPYTAHVFGNHEFDFGPNFLLRFIDAVNDSSTPQPFLSANLDFSQASGYAPLQAPTGLIDEKVIDGRVIARSLIHRDPQTGIVYGIIGATTPALPTISSPGDVKVTPNLKSTTVAENLKGEGER